MRTKRKPRVIHIHGRRWFEKANGNTYHTVVIWVDGELVYKSGITYGYGNHYEQTAEDWLKENGYLKDIGEFSCISRYCDERDIRYIREGDDVTRKKDL